MRKLLATVYCDIRVQFRNGFYFATIFILAFFIVVLRQLPEIEWDWLLPLIILLNMNFTGFYFIGGIVLLEKNEGTIRVQLITPLESGSYLLAKFISLSLLILIESIILAVVLYGFQFRFIYFITGTLLAAFLFILSGFMVITQYDSISDYMLPSVAYAALVSLPLITGFASWDNPLIYLHPLQTALIFLNQAFIPVGVGNMVYAFIYSCIWVLVLYRLCKGVFEKSILNK
ncbi:MAG TPA: hypothetical protein VKY40_08640 [Halanaerobiales bacterium]|nr:hypothetical protein [Halanaerobiales bacterium]